MRSRAPRRRPSSSIGQEPVVKVQRVARMGIDAQRSGASELPGRAVEVRRGRIAYRLPSGCPGTPWYARREFWAGQLAEKVHSSAQHDEGDPGVDRRGGATEAIARILGRATFAQRTMAEPSKTHAAERAL